jgi:hypothetical protein
MEPGERRGQRFEAGFELGRGVPRDDADANLRHFGESTPVVRVVVLNP